MTRVDPGQGWRDVAAADPLGLARSRHDAPPEPAPGRSSLTDLLRLGLVIAAIIGLAFAAGYGETILLIFVLILCIVAHEFGHYIAAKTGNIKVTEFFVGFGPRLWSIRRGETEYGVKGIPLGGYCRIIGMNNLEEVDPADEARTYRRAPLWRRLLIDVAGSSAHFLIALFVLFAMFFWTGDNGHYVSNIPASNPIAQIIGFQGGAVSPAERAGFEVGDRIVSIDGQRFSSWPDQSKFIQTHAGVPLVVVVSRGGRLLTLHATPVASSSLHPVGTTQLPAGNVGILGVGVSTVVHSSFGHSVGETFGAFGYAAGSTLSALGHLVTFQGISTYVHSLSSQKAAAHSPDRLVTVVGLPTVLHQATQSGMPTVLWLLALINISIGLFNLVPLFPLDGGRVLVALYEGVRSVRRPYRVDMAKLLPVMYLGLAVIMFFALGSMFIDLRNIGS